MYKRQVFGIVDRIGPGPSSVEDQFALVEAGLGQRDRLFRAARIGQGQGDLPGAGQRSGRQRHPAGQADRLVRHGDRDLLCLHLPAVPEGHGDRRRSGLQADQDAGRVDKGGVGIGGDKGKAAGGGPFRGAGQAQGDTAAGPDRGALGGQE